MPTCESRSPRRRLCPRTAIPARTGTTPRSSRCGVTVGCSPAGAAHGQLRRAGGTAAALSHRGDARHAEVRDAARGQLEALAGELARGIPRARGPREELPEILPEGWLVGMALLGPARRLGDDVGSQQRRPLPAAQADAADDRGLVGGGPRDYALCDLLSARAGQRAAVAPCIPPALSARTQLDNRRDVVLLPEEHGYFAGFRQESRRLL